jgi:glutathione S-transferase
MITLYHCESARSFRALWALEELGLAYDLKVLPFPPRYLKRDYLGENPLGTVPLLIDGATRMTESAAICEYLAVRYGDGALAVAPGDAAYGAWLNWLHYGEATLTFPQTLVLRYSRFEPPERRLRQVAEDYRLWFTKRTMLLEQALAGHDFLVADRFTAADISVGYAIMLAGLIGTELAPVVRAYFDRLAERPAFRRALAVQEAGMKAASIESWLG